MCDNHYRISLAGDRDPVRQPTVIVADGDDRVVYAELVSEIAQEPDYEAAMAALSRD